MLVVFGGLPGSGKTTLSRRVAAELSATLLRVDVIEAAMWRAGVDRAQPTGIAAYVVAEALTDTHLSLGAAVVIDAVNPVQAARRPWRELAARHDVPLRVVEVVCGDHVEHRRRVEARVSDLTGFAVPTWQQVQAREYEPWREPRLTVDTSEAGVDHLPGVIKYVRQRE